MARLWTRTCQECGYKYRKDTEPSDTRKHSAAYGFVVCKECGSEAYDYGSWQCDESDCDKSCGEQGCLNLRRVRR
jgi:hypothetical protein